MLDPNDKFLFESISNQVHVLRGEIREDIHNLRYEFKVFSDKHDARILEFDKEIARRKGFENKLLGAFGLFILLTQIVSALLPVLVK